MTERDLHRAVADYLSVALQPPTWWTTIGHGAFLGEARLKRGAQMKRAGLKAGVPDILIVHEGRAYWIELKARKGRLSEAQEATVDALAAAGCAGVCLARNIADVAHALAAWGIPTRARAA